MSFERLLSRKVTLRERVFTIQALRYANGCFLSIFEDEEPRLGSLAFALKILDRVTSTTLIPQRHGGTLLNMLAELVASRMEGAATVSLHIKGELDYESVRRILEETRSMLSA